METDYVSRLIKRGFLKRVKSDDEEFFQLKAPYAVYITEEVVENLRNHYVPTEELGGILWAKPKQQKGERFYIVEKINYIRNAIEDRLRSDQYRKANAYLPDQAENTTVMQKVLDGECFPITFHTHPIHGSDSFEGIVARLIQLETSDLDRKESERRFKWGNRDIHFPRALILGNTIGKDLFIGLYGGSTLPIGFKAAKENVQKQNIDSIINSLKGLKLSTAGKIGLGVAGLGILAGAIARPKTALGITIALAPVATLLLSQTGGRSIQYCSLLSGPATILVPANTSDDEV